MENGYVNIDIFNFVYYLSRLTTLQGDGFLHGNKHAQGGQEHNNGGHPPKDAQHPRTQGEPPHGLGIAH